MNRNLFRLSLAAGQNRNLFRSESGPVGIFGNVSSPAGNAGSLRADAARNRGLMLDVVREQLLTHGRTPPMKTIARLAGVGVGTVYRHFPTRQALLEAVGDDGMRRLVAACRSAAEDDDPVAGFERVVEYVLRGQLEDQGIATILAAPDDGCGTPSPVTIRLAAAVDGLLTRVRAAGAIRPEVQADDIRRLLVGLAHAVRPVADDDRRVRLYLRMFLDGLRPAPGD
jgi:AcrR family transcriptional regulator